MTREQEITAGPSSGHSSTHLLAAMPRFAPLAIRLELEPGMLALASLPSQQHQYPGEALGRRAPSPSSMSPRVRVCLVCTSPVLPPGSQHPSQRTSGPLCQKTRATHQPPAPPPSSWQVDTGPVLRRKCPCAMRIREQEHRRYLRQLARGGDCPLRARCFSRSF